MGLMLGVEVSPRDGTNSLNLACYFGLNFYPENMGVQQ